ncbi:LOW QUALITY PROTEIN: hypothetical protein BC936DRAFT_148778 [Jimgerdemannia flammicorona]|uniref:Uncharacterized protein n=1 Tax=Jimgerdemannia flammicorona TaxID=994334 RepID=A0A433D2A4_9FUNG|nr:LOW QUALITY PROTEIN: hypothetical protein BC936DRAFT_148778 [Jimgerdemannia flammicorona]
MFRSQIPLFLPLLPPTLESQAYLATCPVVVAARPIHYDRPCRYIYMPNLPFTERPLTHIPKPGHQSSHTGPRSQGCVFTYNNRFYILVGKDPSSTSNLFVSTPFPIDLTSSQPVWANQSINYLFANMASQNPTTKGLYIRPCVVTPNGTLIVGGNDYIGYDIYNDRWLGTLALSGTYPPSPGAILGCDWSSTCSQRIVTVDDSMWIFQDFNSSTPVLTAAPTGIYVLNLTTFTWSSRTALVNATAGAPVLPPQLFRPTLIYVSAAHLANITNTASAGVIFVVGGDAPVNTTEAISTNTIWIFDIASSLWFLHPANLTQPLEDCYAFFYPPKNRLIIYPGGKADIINTQVNLVGSNTLQLLDLKADSSMPLGIGITVSNQTGGQGQPGWLYDTCTVQQGNSVSIAFGREWFEGARREEGRWFVVYGGWNGTGNTDKFYIYDMEKMQWAFKATATPFATPPSVSTAPATTKPTQPTIPPTNASSEQPALGPIIGGVLGGIVFCALAGLATVFFLRRRRNRERRGQRLAVSSDTEADDKYPQPNSPPSYSGPLLPTHPPSQTSTSSPIYAVLPSPLPRPSDGTIVLTEVRETFKPAEIEDGGENALHKSNT